MLVIISCSVAVLCMAGFVTIWLTTAHTELAAKRTSLSDLEQQLRVQEQLSAHATEGPNAQSAAGMLETSRMLCREAARSYNHILRKPMNRFPALLMGFRAAEEQQQGSTRGDKT